MVARNARSRDGWMTPAALRRATGGRVVRTGPAAVRVHTDSRDLLPGDCFLALTGDRFDGHGFVAAALRAGATGLVVERPLSELSLSDLNLPDGVFVVRVDDSRKALAAIAAEHRTRMAARVVGITGSCGKTSTKDMLAAVVGPHRNTVASPRSFNNDIGVPLSLLAMQPQSEVAVVEIGTSGPGEIAALSAIARPEIGVLTCVSEAHLKGLGSLEGVAREKASLFEGVGVAGDPRRGVAVLNIDDATCRRIAADLEQRVVTIALNREADWRATDVHSHGLGTSFRLNEEHPVTLSRIGSHNVYNALSTIAVAVELGLPLDDVIAGLSHLPASARRLEPKQFGGVRVFDDTYNMNPASARAALAALAGIRSKGRRIVVFGEMLELGRRSGALHRALGVEVARSCVDLLVTVGEGASPIADGAADKGMDEARMLRTTDPRHALELLAGLLQPGDVVLCKASRGVALEVVVDGLEKALALAQRAGTEPARAEGAC